jgi:phage terminase large subunit-like protein
MWSAPGTIARNCPHSCPVRVIAEKNQGGFMVAAVLRTADPDLNVKLVTATCGKSERAEPVAMLFEAGKVTLHGEFPKLEAELLGMIAGGDYEGPGTARTGRMRWSGR